MVEVRGVRVIVEVARVTVDVAVVVIVEALQATGGGDNSCVVKSVLGFNEDY
jgi:hypothetical protein